MNKLNAKVIKVPSDVLDIKACVEDLKFIAGMLKPKFIIPLGGLYMDFINYSTNISKIGFDKKNILILENGSIASFANDEYLGAKQFITLEAKPINIQGNIDSGANSLYERKQMQSSGIVLSNFLVDNKDKKIIRADYEPIGVIDLNKENNNIISEINADITRESEKLLLEFTEENNLNTKEFKLAIRKIITKYYDKKFSKKPLVMCTILFNK
jgi:ribonuclease J